MNPRWIAALTCVLILPAAPALAADPLPPGPWTETLAPGGPEPTAADLFRKVKYDRSAIQEWFAAVPGKPLKFTDLQRLPTVVMTAVDGTARLVPPLLPGTALRLLVDNLNTYELRIVAWAGRAGAAIETEGPNEAPRLCGSVLSRADGAADADGRWLASTSDGRTVRVGIGGWQPAVVELSYVDGMFVLSRGEVRLIEVPLPAPPEEIRFEGRLGIGGIELVRSVAPPPLPPLPPATAAWRPADEAWEGDGAKLLEKLPAGGVQLVQQEANPKAPAIAMWKLPPATGAPQEVIVRIDDASPGTGVCLAGPDGKPAIVCGVVAPTPGGPPDRQGSLFMAWTPDKSPLIAGDPKNLGQAFMPRPVWMRFRVGDGLVVSWSGDGRTWARFRPDIGWPPGSAAIGGVGLFAGAHAGRSITLGHVAVAERPGFAKILPRDLLAAVEPTLVPIADGKQHVAWREATLKAKPADVDDARWLAASAIRCLATNRARISPWLCLAIWKYAESLDLPVADQIAVCDDINRSMSNTLIYSLTARRCADRGDVAGFDAAWRALQQAPSDITYHLGFREIVDPLDTAERMLRRLFAVGPADDLRREAARFALYFNGGFAEGVERQLEAGNPLVIETSNAMSNTAADFEAAIGAGAWDDAQRAAAAATAADACEWLAHRALAAGDFTLAREYVRAGLGSAAAEGRARLLTIEALVDALVGAAGTARVQADLAGIAAAEISAAVAAAPPGPAPAPPVVACPPGDVDAVKRLDLGPAGMAPPASDYPPALSLTWDPRFNGHFASPPFTRYRLDWAAEVSCLVPMGDRLLAGNRAELVSLDPKSGGEQWRLAAGPQPGAVTAIGLMPMRPVCDTRQAYVRRIAHGNAATLAAVSLTDGKLVWETKPDPARVLISDPVLVDGYIRICEVDPAMIDALVLVTIDPATGRRAAVRPMGEVLGSWRVGRSNRADFGDCQITTAGGRLFISAGGAVLCCTAHGEPIWLRQQPWLPVATNGWWWYQAQSPPVVHGEKVYVVQPGVEAVTALDAAMGTIRWRKHVPLVRRMVGIAGKGDAARLVVETGEGVVAVDLRDGDVTTLVDGRDGPGSDWTSLVAPSRLLGAAVATADGQAIVAVQRRRPDTAATATLDAALLWIDVVTGAVRHEAVVPPLTGKPPWVGPLAAAEGKLWLLSQANPADLRRSLWEVTAKPAAPPAQ